MHLCTGTSAPPGVDEALSVGAVCWLQWFEACSLWLVKTRLGGVGRVGVSGLELFSKHPGWGQESIRERKNPRCVVLLAL